MPSRAPRKRVRVRKVYAIDWVDIANPGGAWYSEAKAKALKPPLQTTVGIIVSRNKREIKVVSTICHGILGTVGHGEEPTVSPPDVIPRGVIRRIELIGEIEVRDDPVPEQCRRNDE